MSWSAEEQSRAVDAFRDTLPARQVVFYCIRTVQYLTYLTLAQLAPPLLSLFAEPGSLEYEGGAFNVGTLKGPLYSHFASPMIDKRRHAHGLARTSWKTNLPEAAR